MRFLGTSLYSLNPVQRRPFSIYFSRSSSRRNVGEGCEDSRQLFVTCFFFLLRIFAIHHHAKTTALASRDFPKNDTDVYVRLDLLATIVKRVRLKMITINFVTD